MEDSTIIKLVAIMAIAILEAAALMSGIDGALFMPAMAIIGGIAGYELKGLQMQKKEVKADGKQRID